MSTPATAAKGARKPSAPEGRRELKDIMATARAMQERRLNPFHLDVGEALDVADRFFPVWEEIEDLTLDARAMNALSRVVKLQEGRLRYQVQLFHADPDQLAAKLKEFNTNQLAKIFLGAFHPTVGLEQLTRGALEEAMEYWNGLEPVALRRRERPRKAPPALETVTLDDLMAKGIVPRDTFGGRIAELWEQLQEAGPTDYHEFISAPTHAGKVERAYATSYLVTYGYAALAQRDGKLVLQPRGERDPPLKSVSVPIVIPG